MERERGMELREIMNELLPHCPQRPSETSVALATVERVLDSKEMESQLKHGSWSTAWHSGAFHKAMKP